MDSLTIARQALVNLLNDPDVDLDPEDRDLLHDALGAVILYDED